MKDLLNAIDEIIIPRFKQTTAILGESKKADYPTTKIIKVGKALFCKFDTDELDIFPYFNKTVPFLNSMCDYIIFYPYEKTMFVFLCELKTEKIKNSGKQVEAAKIFAEFVINIAKRHLNFKSFNIEYRALIFSISKTKKRKFSTNRRLFAIPSE